MRLVAALFAAVLGFLLPHHAEARISISHDKTDQGEVFVILSGEFRAGDEGARFKREVERLNAELVLFNSPGGNVASAMAYGRLIRDLGLSTLQLKDHECASACSLAFLGGVERYAEPGSIGVHRATFTDEIESRAAVAAIQELTADIIGYLTEMDVDPALLQIALSVDNADIRYLTGQEMLDLGVTTGDWSELELE